MSANVTVTALDLIKLALKMAGVLAVGQTPLAEDANDALLLLNSFLASWNQSRWLIFHLVDIAAPSTAAQFYTVGPSGNFAVTRPDRIESAYARLLGGKNTVDYPLAVIETYEEYGAIALKNLQSWPTAVFYDPTLVLGKLYVWPIANSLFELHIVIKETLAQFGQLTDSIALPPEYFEALLYSLVGRLQMLYQLPVNPGVVALADASINQVRVANHRVATLSMPPGLSRRTGWPTHGVGGNTGGIFTLDEDTLG